MTDRDDDLPQLPSPDLGSIRMGREVIELGYSPEAMRSYGEACAKAAREKEREECARIFEDPALADDVRSGWAKVAKAIRARKP